MAIRPKTVTKARGVGTAQAVRESEFGISCGGTQIRQLQCS